MWKQDSSCMHLKPINQHLSKSFLILAGQNLSLSLLTSARGSEGPPGVPPALGAVTILTGSSPAISSIRCQGVASAMMIPAEHHLSNIQALSSCHACGVQRLWSSPLGGCAVLSAVVLSASH